MRDHEVSQLFVPATPHIPSSQFPDAADVETIETEEQQLLRLSEDLLCKITEENKMEAERTLRLSEIDELFQDRIKELEQELKRDEEGLRTTEEELDVLMNPPIEEPPPPGPACLMWILSEYFNLVATIVIVTNIVCMILELTDERYEAKFFWMDQSFMIFYIHEIVLKAVLLQGRFLCGSFATSAWNWLDSIIVGSGMVDMYLQPLLVAAGLMKGGGNSLKFLSFLRMLRLLRILKIVGMFMKADLSWAQGEAFSVFIMGVIGFNSVLMGLESDLPDFFLWFYIEQLLLVIFTFELAVRLKHFGCRFFYHETDIVWNLLDFTIVLGGIIDQWMMPMIALIKRLMGQKSHGSGSLGQVMMMLRMARLLRILRLVRLVKNIPPLFTLVVGIMKAMQGMMWVLVLTFILLYACALLCVKLIGHGMLFPAGAPNDVTAIFPSILDSMFVLFKAMNGDWSQLEPLFAVMPVAKFVFFIYTVVSSWGILSILTAVVSENMINATEEHRAEIDLQESKISEIQKETDLQELFLKVAGEDKKIDKEDFEKLMSNAGGEEEIRKRMLEVSGMSDYDLKQVFGYLSKVNEAGKPVIDMDDFINGLKTEKRLVSERAMMRMEHRIQDLEDIARDASKELLQESIDNGQLPKDVVHFILFDDE